MDVNRKAIKFLKLITKQLKGAFEDGCEKEEMENMFLNAVKTLKKKEIRSEIENNAKKYFKKFEKFLKRARKTEDEETGNDRFPVNLYHVEGQGTAEVNASSADEQWKIVNHVIAEKLHAHPELMNLLESPPSSTLKFPDLEKFHHAMKLSWKTSTETLLQVLLQYFKVIQNLADDVFKSEDQNRVEDLIEEIKGFICIMHLKWQQCPQCADAKKTSYHDYLASLLSIYIDLMILSHRSDDQPKKTGKQLCGYIVYLLPWQQQLNVLLELSQVTDKDQLILPFVKSCLKWRSGTKDKDDFLRYILATRNLYNIFGELLNAAYEACRAVAAPKKFMTWLSQQDAELVEEFPNDKKFKGTVITEFLLKDITEDQAERLMDILVVSLEEETAGNQSSSDDQQTTDDTTGGHMTSGDGDFLFFIDKGEKKATRNADMFFIDKGGNRETEDSDMHQKSKDESEASVAMETSDIDDETIETEQYTLDTVKYKPNDKENIEVTGNIETNQINENESETGVAMETNDIDDETIETEHFTDDTGKYKPDDKENIEVTGNIPVESDHINEQKNSALEKKEKKKSRRSSLKLEASELVGSDSKKESGRRKSMRRTVEAISDMDMSNVTLETDEDSDEDQQTSLFNTDSVNKTHVKGTPKKARKSLELEDSKESSKGAESTEMSTEVFMIDTDQLVANIKKDEKIVTLIPGSESGKKAKKKSVRSKNNKDVEADETLNKDEISENIDSMKDSLDTSLNNDSVVNSSLSPVNEVKSSPVKTGSNYTKLRTRQNSSRSDCDETANQDMDFSIVIDYQGKMDPTVENVSKDLSEETGVAMVTKVQTPRLRSKRISECSDSVSKEEVKSVVRTRRGSQRLSESSDVLGDQLSSRDKSSSNETPTVRRSSRRLSESSTASEPKSHAILDAKQTNTNRRRSLRSTLGSDANNSDSDVPIPSNVDSCKILGNADTPRSSKRKRAFLEPDSPSLNMDQSMNSQRKLLSPVQENMNDKEKATDLVHKSLNSPVSPEKKRKKEVKNANDLVVPDSHGESEEDEMEVLPILSKFSKQDHNSKTDNLEVESEKVNTPSSGKNVKTKKRSTPLSGKDVKTEVSTPLSGKNVKTKKVNTPSSGKDVKMKKVSTPSSGKDDLTEVSTPLSGKNVKTKKVSTPSSGKDDKTEVSTPSSGKDVKTEVSTPLSGKDVITKKVSTPSSGKDVKTRKVSTPLSGKDVKMEVSTPLSGKDVITKKVSTPSSGKNVKTKKGSTPSSAKDNKTEVSTPLSGKDVITKKVSTPSSGKDVITKKVSTPSSGKDVKTEVSTPLSGKDVKMEVSTPLSGKDVKMKKVSTPSSGKDDKTEVSTPLSGRDTGKKMKTRVDSIKRDSRKSTPQKRCLFCFDSGVCTEAEKIEDRARAKDGTDTPKSPKKSPGMRLRSRKL